MKYLISLFILAALPSLGSSNPSFTKEQTNRVMQFSNNHVSVWETVIYPSQNHMLKMHRHDHDRVLVAFTDGLIKVTNDQGKVHYLKWVKNKAYYLPKDPPNERHSDTNVTNHPIKVVVIQLLSS